MSESWWRQRPDGIEIHVRVTPRGGRDAVDGPASLSDGRAVLKLRVRAVPEDGAANEAVRRLLAESLGVARSAVSLLSGASARQKTFLVEGEASALAAHIGRLNGDSGA